MSGRPEVPENIEMDRYGIVRCAACGAPIGAHQPLTPVQLKVLVFVRQFIKDNGLAPNFTEIMTAMGWKTLSGVHYHLIALERKGWLRRGYKTSRDITLIEPQELPEDAK